jgi:hypothetical protein
MPSFHIDVMLNGGHRRERHDRIGTLSEACIFAFTLAETLSGSGMQSDADVHRVDVRGRERLHISIVIMPGQSLTG